MQLPYDTPTPLEYFATLVASDEQFPLLEAAASIAQDEYPSLDVQQVLGDVDQLVARLKRRIPADAPHIQRLRALNQFFTATCILHTVQGHGAGSGLPFPINWLFDMPSPNYVRLVRAGQ